MTKLFFHLALLVVSVLSFSCYSKTYAKNTNTTKLEINEGEYILPPSCLLDGTKREVNWIWSSGEVKPRNYNLHVRKNFTLNNSYKKAGSIGSKCHSFIINN